MEILINGQSFDIGAEFIQIDDSLVRMGNAWLSPEGEEMELVGSIAHSQFARDTLGYTGDNPTQALIRAGWIRKAAKNCYECWELNDQTKWLILESITKGTSDKVLIDIQSGLTKHLALTRQQAIEYLEL